jgi:hypothetical protein
MTDLMTQALDSVYGWAAPLTKAERILTFAAFLEW